MMLVNVAIAVLDAICDCVEFITGKPVDYVEGVIGFFLISFVVICVSLPLLSWIKKQFLQITKASKGKRFVRCFVLIMRGVMAVILLLPCCILTAIAFVIRNRNLIFRTLTRGVRVLLTAIAGIKTY